MKYHNRICLFVLLLLLCLGIGCGGTKETPESPAEEGERKALEKETEMMAKLYETVYQEARQEGKLGELETAEKMLACLGRQGYTAIDWANQVDMVNPESVEAFQERVEQKEEGQVMVLKVLHNGDLLRIDCTTEEGKVTIRKISAAWEEDGSIHADIVEKFTAKVWKYTEKGYLMIEKEQPAGFDGPSGYEAIRVQPLDRICREMNRCYILPVSYRGNNFFLLNWTEDDYGEMCMADLYEPFYTLLYGERPDVEPEEGTVHISSQTLEQVFTAYLQVTPEQLRERISFDGSTGEYLWHSRGPAEVTGMELPYPEVTEVEERADGTIALTVEAVWAMEHTDQAFVHRVVICPGEDGTFYYQSNTILSDEKDPMSLYTKRLTEEELEESRMTGQTAQACFRTASEEERDKESSQDRMAREMEEKRKNRVSLLSIQEKSDMKKELLAVAEALAEEGADSEAGASRCHKSAAAAGGNGKDRICSGLQYGTGGSARDILPGLSGGQFSLSFQSCVRDPSPVNKKGQSLPLFARRRCQMLADSQQRNRHRHPFR